MMKARGGIRIGDVWETWPSAQLCIEPDRLILRYRGERAIPKEEVEVLSFLRGSFTTEIRITHRSDIALSPIRFYPLFSRDMCDFAKSQGYQCEERKAPFYTKGDFVD
jgi:hypothetical protein